jgi:hypothetical protein
MRGTLVEYFKGIKPLPKFMSVGTAMVLTGGGSEGLTMPPLVAAITGVWRLPHEVVSFSSITAHRIK